MTQDAGFGAGSPAAGGIRRVRRIAGGDLPFLPYGLVPAAALALLFGLALLPVAFGHVQHAAEQTAQRALESIGASWAAPSVSGQWVVLHGAPPTREAAVLAVETVRNASASTIFGPARPITRVTENFIWLDEPAGGEPGMGGPAEAGFEPASAPAEACGAFLPDTLQGVTIEFDTGSAVISARSAALLDQLTLAAACPGALRIEGHTDDVGGDAFNLDLSRRRANAVRTALIQRGADPERLYAQGHGAGRPIAQNDTEEGRARNRRIEIRAVPN
jgi:outer membrane protein OmpA-like peptidoglycan-associated protein